MTRGFPAAALLLLGLVASGCRKDAPAPPVLAAASSGALASPAPSATRQTPSRYATDPRFRVASLEDPLERARLAAAEGASGLLEALGDGGEVASAALLALPHADDADLALRPLSERAVAAAGPGGERSLLPPLLQALLEIAGRPTPPREPLDLEGARAAAEAVLALAQRRDLDADARALAISAARAMAERGLLDPAKIPTDLDPPE